MCSLKTLHFKTAIGSFLLTCGLLYICLIFHYQSTDITNASKRSDLSQNTGQKAKNVQRISISKVKKRMKTISIPANTATFIMLEGRRISDHLGLVYWTFINSAYEELTLNWLCHTSTMVGVHERVFIITVDEATADKLRSHWPRISVLSLKMTVFNSSLTWGEQQYIDFLVLRASIVRLFVENDVKFVLFETDSIWLRNPVGYFKNYSGADITLPKKHQADSRGRDLTFDPMIVSPNKRTKLFFHELYQRSIPSFHVNGSLYDQDMIDDLCKARFANVHCQLFPWSEIADGKWFRLSEQQRRSLITYVVNNNFYSGVTNKITRQALNDLWYLTVDKQCDHAKVMALDESVPMDAINIDSVDRIQ